MPQKDDSSDMFLYICLFLVVLLHIANIILGTSAVNEHQNKYKKTHSNMVFYKDRNNFHLADEWGNRVVFADTHLRSGGNNGIHGDWDDIVVPR